MTITDVLTKIADTLDWRGPNGKTMGHVVLKREEALLLMAWVEAGAPNVQDVWGPKGDA